MKKVLIILIAMVICANSFGEILVYKVSDSMSGFAVVPSWAPNAAQNFKGGIRGYVVVSVNTTTLNTNTSSDANNKPAFIAVDHREFVIFDGNNPKVQTKFDLTQPINPADPNNTRFNLKFEILTKNGKATNKVIVLPQFYFVYNATSPKLSVQFFQTQSVLVGQLDTVDIGVPIKAVIPKSIKGQAFYNVLTDFGGSQSSIGNVSFKLDNSFTKTANTGAIPMMVSETIDFIQQELVKRGHTEVTFTKFFGQ